MAALLAPSLIPTLHGLAAAMIPEIAAADPAEWAALQQTIARALAARPRAVGRQLVAFIRVLDLVALVRYGRRIARLDAARLTALLQRLATSRVLLLRRGVWGLRTLLMLGWYTQPSVTAALGYRAEPAGWSRAGGVR